jgi:hypothetical protein
MDDIVHTKAQLRIGKYGSAQSFPVQLIIMFEKSGAEFASYRKPPGISFFKQPSAHLVKINEEELAERCPETTCHAFPGTNTSGDADPFSAVRFH